MDSVYIFCQRCLNLFKNSWIYGLSLRGQSVPKKICFNCIKEIRFDQLKTNSLNSIISNWEVD